MKIALIRQRYTDFGGAERYVAGLAGYLRRLGHEVHIFAASWRSSTQDKDRSVSRSGITFHRVPVAGGLSFIKVLSFALNSRRLLKGKDFDVIHSFERTLYQDIYRAGDGCHREWLKQREKIDPWYKKYLHPLNPLHRTILSIEQKIFTEDLCKMIIANSFRGKDEIVRHYGVPSTKIRVIYNPVDVDRFNGPARMEMRDEVRKTLGVADSDRCILFVGSGFKRKGLLYAITAASKLRETWQFIVIGRDRASAYEKEASRLGIRPFVHFLGPVTDVEKYYLAADLFLFPTIYEPFSNACLEAMAAGLPIVTSRINGVSEIVVEGTNGYVIEDPLNTDEIKDRIERALQLTRDSVIEHNREYLKPFSWQNHVRQLMEVYSDITGKNLKNG